MNHYVNPVINYIASINHYQAIPSRYHYIAPNKQYLVKSVDFPNDTSLVTKLFDNQEFHVTIVKENNNQFSISCNCTLHQPCLHKAIAIFYIRDNLDRLDIKYILNHNPQTVNYTTVLLEKLRENNYTGDRTTLKPEQLTSLHQILVDNLFYFYKENFELSTYFIFFKSMDYFLKIDFLYTTKKQTYIDMFYEITRKTIPMWGNILSQINITNFLPVFEMAATYITNEERAKQYLNFILDIISDSSFIRTKTAGTLTYTLGSKSLALAKQYLSENDYISYSTKIAHFHYRLESEFILYLLEKNYYQELLNYIGKKRYPSSLLNIARKAIDYKQDLINADSFIKSVVPLYQVMCLYEDILLIKTVLGDDLFRKNQEIFLKITKKNNKDTYYRLVSSLDYENGFSLIKQAGVFVMNNYLDLFLPQKEEELILYYQEQLYDFFCTNKGTGVRYLEAIKACDSLAKMKNGKYYVFSVYRMARLKNDYSNALYDLSFYINNLDL